MKPLKSSRRAMTLLETVVSVSILMLLSALIFNIFKTGSEAWMKAESKNELSQKLRNIINKVQLRTERSSYRSVSIGKEGDFENGDQISVISFLQYDDDPSNRANLVKEVGHETFLEYDRYAAFVWIQQTGSLYYVPGANSSNVVPLVFESSLQYPPTSAEAASWESDKCIPRPYSERGTIPSPHDPSWSVNADNNYRTKGAVALTAMTNSNDIASDINAQLIATNVIHFEALPDGPLLAEELVPNPDFDSNQPDDNNNPSSILTNKQRATITTPEGMVITKEAPLFKPDTSKTPNKNSPYIRLQIVVEDPHAKITGERFLDATTSLVFRNP